MQIIPNFLSADQLQSVNKILELERWGFGYVSNDPHKPIWNFNKEESKKIADILMEAIPDYTLADYHVNGQSIMQSGAPHTDSSCGCTHALVFFPYKWDYTWGGRLHVFTDNGVGIITPEQNLAVLFDSSLTHYAEAPVVPVLRVSVGLKLSCKTI